jgi:hypothetical protein
MGHQPIDELARMERICQELAGQATKPEERAGLLIMANNIAPRSPAASGAIDLPTRCPHKAFSVG